MFFNVFFAFFIYFFYIFYFLIFSMIFFMFFLHQKSWHFQRSKIVFFSAQKYFFLLRANYVCELFEKPFVVCQRLCANVLSDFRQALCGDCKSELVFQCAEHSQFCDAAFAYDGGHCWAFVECQVFNRQIGQNHDNLKTKHHRQAFFGLFFPFCLFCNSSWLVTCQCILCLSSGACDDWNCLYQQFALLHQSAFEHPWIQILWHWI